LLFFDFFYLVYPGDMPSTLELSAEEVLNDSLYLRFALLRRQAANLSVIMQSGTVSGKNIVALGGPYPSHFIGGDAHANAGAAYQYASIILTSDDSLGHLHGDIGIVNRILRIATEIMIAVTRLGDYFDNELLESTTMVVITDGNMHRNNLLYKVTTINRD
jgi:hypothetical protein